MREGDRETEDEEGREKGRDKERARGDSGTYFSLTRRWREGGRAREKISHKKNNLRLVQRCD